MPLSKQLFPLQFGQGIDTKTDAKLVVPGRLLELENGVFTKIGSIRKRNGFTRLSTDIVGGDALDRADGLAVFRDELLLFGDDGRVYSRSEALSGWVDRGAVVSCELRNEPIVRNTYAQSNPDSATYGGVTVTAWEDSRGGVRYSVRDDATGTLFVADAEVASAGAQPRVVVFQGELAIFYGVTNNIFYRRISPSAPSSIGVEVNPISTLLASSPVFDVLVVVSGLYVGFNSASGFDAASIDSTWAVASTGNISITTNVGLALFATQGGDIGAARQVSGGQRVDLFDTSLSPTASVVIASETPTGLITATPIGDNQAVVFFSTGGGGGGGTLSARVTFDFGAGTATAASTQLVAADTRPCARAFVQDGAAYCPVTWDSTLQSGVLVMAEAADSSTTSAAVIAKTVPGTGGGHRTNSTVATTTETSDGVFSFAASVVTSIESGADTLYTRDGVERITVDFTSSYRYASAELGGNLLIAGGCLNAYDGRTICESGFHFFPEGLSGTLSAHGSLGLSAGVYQWRAIYEWTDAQGQIHRSAPSPALQKTASANDKITLTLPNLSVTQKPDVRIVVYRTEADGSVFYRLNASTAPIVNSPYDAQTYVDSAADSDITGNEVLYTDGTANQELENIAPGACSLITTHRGRAFVKTGENRISYSKVAFDGEPPAFNDGLYLLPDGRGGDVTALAGMDDKLVIFKERAIFVVGGDGPSNTGAGDYAEPVLVTSDVGCDEPRSVALTNAGLMFHSPKGIYLLDRSLAVTYIGAPVELFNSLAITSAAVVPSNNQVRFTTSGTITRENGETQTDLVLVYDYLMNQWSTFTNIAAVDAAVWGDTYVWAKSDGRVYEEAADTYTDDGSFIRLRFVTSWVSLGQLNGFQRIYRLLLLGDYEGSHSLRVRLGYDFKPEYTFDQTINATSVTGPDTWGSDATWGSGSVWGGAWPLEWFRVSPARQKCSAIRICVEDSQSSSYNEGFAITGIGILAGVKSGTNKMAATRSV